MTPRAAPTHPRPTPATKLGADTDRLAIDTIRTLAIDAVQKAKSGHAGAPMGFAPVAYTVWQDFLRYDPADPLWANRDRFVLSNGHACLLLYALIHLAGVSGRMAKKKSPTRPRSASTTSRASARSTALRRAIRNTAAPPALRPRPARSAKAAATASAWRSPRAGSAPITIGRISRCSTSMFTRSAATAISWKA